MMSNAQRVSGVVSGWSGLVGGQRPSKLVINVHVIVHYQREQKTV
jgi:hypothetical protein